MGNTTIK